MNAKPGNTREQPYREMANASDAIMSQWIGDDSKGMRSRRTADLCAVCYEKLRRNA